MPITPPENSVTSQIWGWMKVDCGPTIGWVHRPMFNDKYIVAGTSYDVQPFDFQLLIAVNADFTINLPAVATWLRQPWGMFPLFIKDVGYFAGTHNITAARAGSDLIYGDLATTTSAAIVSDGGSMSLRPKSDLTGWTLTP